MKTNKSTTRSNCYLLATIAVADIPNYDGDVYTEEMCKQLMEKYSNFIYDPETKVLSVKIFVEQ